MATDEKKREWAKKFATSMSNSVKFTIREISPNIYYTADSSVEAVKDIRKLGTKISSMNRQQSFDMKKTKMAKEANSIFNRAKSDLRDASFGRRISDELYDDFEEINDDLDLENWDDEKLADSSPEDIMMAGSAGVAKSIIASSTAQLRGLDKVSSTISNTTLQASRASTESINNTMLYSVNLMNSSLLSVGQKLDNISSGISGLLEYNNNVLSTAIDSMTTFFDRQNEMMEQIGSMFSSMFDYEYGKSKKEVRKFDTSSGFDPKEYLDYVKSGFGGGGLLGMLFGDMLSEVKGTYKGLKDDPIGTIISTAITKLIPKNVKKSLTKLDDHLPKYIDEILKRISAFDDKLYDDPYVTMAMSMLGLGNIFGSKREKVGSINMGRYQKDALPWNGFAQRAITEVMPEYLSSIDNTLLNIDKMLSVKFKDDGYTAANSGTKKYYDYDQGKFKEKDQIEKDFFDQIAINYGNMTKSMDTIINMLEDQSQDSINAKTTRINQIMNDRINDTISEMEMRKALAEELSYIQKQNRTKFRQVIMGIVDGVESGNKDTSDLYNTVGSSGSSVYRNINNQYGKEAYKKRSVGSRNYQKDKTIDFFRFSSRNISPEDKDFLLGRIKILGLSPELLDEGNNAVTLSMMLARVEDQHDIDTKLRDLDTEYKMDKFGKGGFFGLFGGKNSTRGLKTSKAIEKFDNSLFERVYKMRDLEDIAMNSNSASSKSTMKNKSDELAKLALENMPNGSGSKIFNRDQSEVKRDDSFMSEVIKELSNIQSANTVEESIINSNNATVGLFAQIGMSFQNFTSSIFGKGGLISSFWDSDTGKDGKEKVREYFFNEDEGVFADEVKKGKEKRKGFFDAMKDSFFNGYDFVFDNTMRYIYGEDYENNDNYKKYLAFFDFKDKRDRKREDKEKAEALANGEPLPEVLSGFRTIKSPTDYERISKKGGVDLGDGTAVRSLLTYDGKDTGIGQLVFTNSIINGAEKIDKATDELADKIKGEDADVEKALEETSKTFFGKVKERLPKAAVAGLAGAGFGAISAFSNLGILGSAVLPGGPIGGALVGSGLYLLSQTEAVKSILFGKMDEETGDRYGGLINKEMKESFKKHLPYVVGGATLGVLKSLILPNFMEGTTLGFITNSLLPGGVIGGAILGIGLGLLKNNETINRTLFGEKDEDGKRSGTVLSKFYNNAKGGLTKAFPYLGRAASGFATGALSSVVFNHMGFLPAMLTVGPVGMGIAGMAVGLASSSKRFNEMLFGTDELDKDGNPTGKKTTGLLTRVTNVLKVNVVDKFTQALEDNVLNLANWAKRKITIPFRMAFGPILETFTDMKDNVVDYIKDKINIITDGVISTFKTVFSKIFSPFTTLVGKVVRASMTGIKLGAEITTAPLSAGLQMLTVATAGKRKAEYKDYYKNYYQNVGGFLQQKWDRDEAGGNKRGFFGRGADRIEAMLGRGEIAELAKSEWNSKLSDLGKNPLNWRGAASDLSTARKDKKSLKEQQKMWKEADALRKKIMKEDLGYRELDLSDTQVETYRKAFAKIKGFDADKLQTSDDVMNLLYRKNDWKKGPLNPETPEQAKAREQTENFQNKNLELLEDIREKMGEAAAGYVDKLNEMTDETRKRKHQRKLAKKAKKRGIDLDAYSLAALGYVDLDLFDNDAFQDFKLSDETDFVSFMNKKQKRRDKENEILGMYNEEAANLDPNSNTLDEINESLKNIAETNQDIADTNTVQVEVATDGDINHEEIRKMRKRSGRGFFSGLGKRKAENYTTTESETTSFWNRLFRRNKEEEESEEVQEGASSALTTNTTTAVATTENAFNSLYKRLSGALDSLLGSAGAFFSTPIGSMVSTAFKRGGILYGLLGLGLGVAEIIKPGSQAKAINAVNNLAETMQNADIYKDFIKPVLDKTTSFISEGFSKVLLDFPKWMREHGEPAIMKAIDGIANNMGMITRIMEKAIVTLVPPMVKAFFTVAPEIITTLVKAIWNSTVGKYVPSLRFKDSEGNDFSKSEQDTSDWSSEEVSEQMQSYKDAGMAAVYDEKNQRIIYYTGSNVKGIDEQGNAEYVQSDLGHEMTRPLVRGIPTIMRAARTGSDTLLSKAAKAMIKVPTALGGGAVGAVTGAILPGMSAISGGATGATIGRNIGDGIVSGLGSAGQKLGGSLTDILLGNSNTGNQILSNITAKAISNIDADDVQDVVNKAFIEGGEASVPGALKGLVKERIQSELAESGYKAIPKMLETATSQGVEALSGNADNAVAKSMKEMAKRSAEVVAEGASEAVKENKKGFITKVFNWTFKKIRGALSTISKIVSHFTKDSKIASAIVEGLLTVANKCMSTLLSDERLYMKWGSRLMEKLALMGVSTTPLALVFGVYDLVSGFMEASNLFHVDKEYVDIPMRIISSVFKTLTGISWGFIIDFIIEVLGAINNTDYKCTWATALYKAIAGFFNNENMLDRIEQGQKEFSDEYTKFMEENPDSNMTFEQYNDDQHKGVLSSMWSSVKNFFKGNSTSNTSASSTTMSGNYSSSSVGTGNTDTALGFGNVAYSQKDSRWANTPLGILPNGKPSNMAQGGCGPTSLAMVANTIGAGNINPGSVGRFAASNGYISQGGSNAKLFTEGAARLGLNSTALSSSGDIIRALAAGSPTIIAGVGTGNTTPYTNSGHIVVGNGIDANGNAIITDPLTGKTSSYSLSGIVNNSTASWTYGYGDVNVDAVTGATPSVETHVSAEEYKTTFKDVMKATTSNAVKSKVYLILFKKVLNILEDVVPYLNTSKILLKTVGAVMGEDKAKNTLKVVSETAQEYLEKGLLKISKNPELTAKYAPTLFEKISKYLMNKTAIGIVLAGWNGVSGAFEAERLFNVSSEYVDAKMRIVSSFMKVLLSAGIITAIFDIVAEVEAQTTGIDYKCEFATKLYEVLSEKVDYELLLQGQKQMKEATDEYNRKTGSELTVSEYTDKTNKSLGGTIWSSLKSTFKKIGSYVLSTSVSGNSADTRVTSNYTSNLSSSEINSKLSEGWGSIGYGIPTLSQKNAQWSNQSIGTLPSGRISTMADGGCGPTSLAIVASELSGGMVNPGKVGQFAAKNGYITAGGANGRLFTEGAARMGLNGVQLSNGSQALEAIASGVPTILSGKSGSNNSKSTPYTKDGHIVVANGIDANGNIIVKDPLDGKTKTYNAKSLLNNATGSWAYGYGALGYGASTTGSDMLKEIDNAYANAKKAQLNLINTESELYGPYVTGDQFSKMMDNAYEGNKAQASSNTKAATSSATTAATSSATISLEYDPVDKMSDNELSTALYGMMVLDEDKYNALALEADAYIEEHSSGKAKNTKRRLKNEYIYKNWNSYIGSIDYSTDDATITSDNSIEGTESGVLSYLAEAGSSGNFLTLLGLLSTTATGYLSGMINGDRWSGAASALNDINNAKSAISNAGESISSLFSSNSSTVGTISSDVTPETAVSASEWNRKYKNYKEKAAASAELFQRVGVAASVPPALGMAQAIKETSFGKTGYALSGNGMFNIKKGSWTGPMVGDYRAYPSIGDGIIDWGRLLTGEKYAGVRRAKTLDDALVAVKAAGYAEDPNYVSSIRKIINQYDLEQYDNVQGWGVLGYGKTPKLPGTDIFTPLISSIPGLANFLPKDEDDETSSSKSSSGTTTIGGRTIASSYSGVGNNAKDWVLKSLKNPRISSDYGMRMHPLSKKYKMHNGIDYAAGGGTPIYTPVSGTVVRSSDGYNGGFGNLVVVKDSKGYQHYFAHQSQRNASSGSRLSKGALIGRVGTTGASTGNHLHYGIKQPSGGWMDPDSYSLGYGIIEYRRPSNTLTKGISLIDINTNKKYNVQPNDTYYGVIPATSQGASTAYVANFSNKGVEERLDSLINVVSGIKDSSNSNINIVNSGNTNNVQGGNTVNTSANNASPNVRNDKLKQMHKVLAAI